MPKNRISRYFDSSQDPDWLKQWVREITENHFCTIAAELLEETPEVEEDLLFWLCSMRSGRVKRDWRWPELCRAAAVEVFLGLDESDRKLVLDLAVEQTSEVE